MFHFEVQPASQGVSSASQAFDHDLPPAIFSITVLPVAMLLRRVDDP